MTCLPGWTLKDDRQGTCQVQEGKEQKWGGNESIEGVAAVMGTQ